MRKFLAILFLALFVFSCDDGDIIVTEFDFEDSNLNLCSIGNLGNNNIFYKIDNTNLKTFSLSFSNNNFEAGTTANLQSADTISFVLNQNNQVLYRTYDGEIPSNYFCVGIPPTHPLVLEEYYSTGGTVSFITFVTEQDDNDNVLAEDEDLNSDGNLFNDDTDNDGIPDFLDIDDDGDGLVTSIEQINPDPTNETFPDTDEDGIPDYLDNDDDGDGILTIYEDADGDGDPRNDDTNENGIPDYLDSETAVSHEASAIPLNTIPRKFRTVVRVENLSLTNGDETITEANTTEFGVYNTGTVPYTLFPD